MDQDNGGVIVLESAEQLNNYQVFNADFAAKHDGKYLLLGESFYSATFFNLLTGELNRFSNLGNICVPDRVIEYLISVGEMTRDELELKTFSGKQPFLVLSTYLRELGAYLNKTVSLDATQYGNGNAGFLSKERLSYIAQTFGYHH